KGRGHRLHALHDIQHGGNLKRVRRPEECCHGGQKSSVVVVYPPPKQLGEKKEHQERVQAMHQQTGKLEAERLLAPEVVVQGEAEGGQRPPPHARLVGTPCTRQSLDVELLGVDQRVGDDIGVVVEKEPTLQPGCEDGDG